MNIQAMGGPVGGGGPPMNAGTPSNSANSYSPEIIKQKLNTAIYDYLLRNGKYEIARSFVDQMSVDTKADTKESPSQRAGQQVNGVDDGMDDDAVAKRPDGLPLPNNLMQGPFLQDWWFQYWEIWQTQRNILTKAGLQSYVNNQRMAQKGRFNMLGAMDPNTQNMRGGYNVMQGMNNGMAMGQNDLRKTTLQQNNQQRQLYVG